MFLAIQINRRTKGGDEELCMARKRTQEYCRISRTMTQPCAIMHAELVWLFVWLVIIWYAKIGFYVNILSLNLIMII